MYGLWTSETAFLEQYLWQDESSLLHTSTAQLRNMQASHQLVRHSALLKWEIRLNCGIPDDIWTSTWLPFRGSCENTFLWQLVYQGIATQKNLILK